MCQIVILGKSGIKCETVSELKQALPDLKLVKCDSYETIDDNSCLCQVDLEETFDNAGFEWESRCMVFTLSDL